MTSAHVIRSPTERRVRANGVELCIFEWHGEAPTVLLVHATGMHGRCWDAVVERLPGAHVLSVELRGHGRSEKRPPYVWDGMSRDIAELCARLGLERAVGVGHSMGGYCIAWTAAEDPTRFRAIVLVDPVILPPDEEAARRAEPRDDAHFTARRRDRFASPDAMYERLRPREPYVRWRDDVLRAYCTHGVVRDEATGDYVLACPPAVESAVYLSRVGADIYERAARIAAPATVLRGRREGAEPRARYDFSRSPTWPGLAAHMPHAKDVYLADCSHFIPMEAPERVAEAILAARGAP
jgi:pimeloyl-ACP methyl ester carboxylesterase